MLALGRGEGFCLGWDGCFSCLYIPGYDVMFKFVYVYNFMMH